MHRSSSKRVLIDQTCFGCSGGLAPISLPLFQGVRLLTGEQFSLSDMIVLLVWGFFCQELSAERPIFLPSLVSLFDLKARFIAPTRSSARPSRAGAVKVGRRANLAACSELTRPYLDSSEHDGTLGAIGMTIGGEPAFGRGSVAPQPCIRWVEGPEP